MRGMYYPVAIVDDSGLNGLVSSYYGQILERHLDVDLVNGYDLRTFANVYPCSNSGIIGCWYCFWTGCHKAMVCAQRCIRYNT